ncbi:MAG: DUF1211 domain-containing protein [Candidatus Omnitrophica bacterium]|nr:DUF1211 domain-containing protein [Candidatus Omnitrophota bacterium]
MNIELKTNRLENLSDGIFAFAMTLLIFGFDIFLHPPQSITEPDLVNLLLSLWPELLHYAEGFIILGVLWLEHHQQFHYIKRTDSFSLLINAFGLMFIALIPVSAALVGDYGHVFTAAFLFETNLFFTGMFFYVHWKYATRKFKLVDQDIDPSVVKFYNKRCLIIPFVSVISMIVSLFNPRIGLMLYFIVPFLFAIHKSK